MFSLIKSGMATAMHELSVVSNNIANANSNGFKKTLVSFNEMGIGFQQSKLTLPLWDEEQLVGVVGVVTVGAILETGSKTDLALTGNGMFVLKPKTTTPIFTEMELLL